MQPVFAMVPNALLAEAFSDTVWYFSYLFSMGALMGLWSILMKWILFGRVADGQQFGGKWWDWRVYICGFWNFLAYALFYQWWVEGSMLTACLYRLWGAKVSFLSGVRFF